MNCVFEILYDLYGEPVWLNKPKDGQEPEKIIEQWIKELGDYSETQLKQACYNLFKYKKVATFPKLAHILAELSDQQKECVQNKSSQTHFTGVCLEVEFMRRDIRLNKCKYTLPIYKAAFTTLLTIYSKSQSANENIWNLSIVIVMMAANSAAFNTEKLWNWACLIILMKH